MAGIRIRPADNDIALGIERVRKRLRNGTIQISSACRNLVEEAAMYRYKDSEDKLGADDAPVKDNDHAMDALRYLVAGLDKQMAQPRLTVLSA